MIITVTNIHRTITFRVLLIGVILAFGCNRKIADVSLPYDVPEEFTATGTEAMPDEWWQAFEDSTLNQLIDTALSANLNLQNVWYQLEESQAIVRQSGSFQKPDVDMQIRTGISRPRPDFVGGENTQISLGVSYEVDLWGRIRYNQHADRYRMEASYHDFKTAAISLSAEIALAWFRLKAVREQLDLLDEQIEINTKVLSLIRARFGSGQVRGVDILRQRQLIQSTQSQKVTLQAQYGVLKNQLAVLLGRVPSASVKEITEGLPDPPPLPDAGIPMQLINRRPDVLSAYNNLQAADRQQAAAISAKYPRFNLDILGAIRSNTFDNLWQSQAVSLTGGLLAPLFYGGRLSAAVDQAEAIKNQQIANYGQTVLGAIQEVENALLQEEKQLENIRLIEEQIELAEKSYQQLRIEYLNGISEYLDVLTSLNQTQQLQRDLITRKLMLLETRVGLYRALAGGFETNRDINLEQ